MAALPTEIITEILLRLPVKSLLRFKCVCKFWNSLIKTPNFIKLHLNQTLISNSDRHLLFCYESLHSAELDHNHISFSEVQLPLSVQGIELYGSCNGISCIANKTEILLFNPLTKSHFKLPFNPDPNPNRVTRFARRLELGFGYDSKSDDYKVLKLSRTNDMVEAELYSRNNDSWKSVQGIYAFTLHTHGHGGVLVNEALHFKLTELGGCLCAFVNYYEMDFLRCDLWVIKEYGNKESWVRLFSIGNECILRCLRIVPIIYSKDEKIFLLDIDILNFGWYDLESKKFDATKPHGLRGPVAIECFVGCFVGSLVSIEDKLQFERETLPMTKKRTVDNVQDEAMT